jgi:hypothetical protein
MRSATVMRNLGAGVAVAAAGALACGAAVAGIWTPGLGLGARIDRTRTGPLPPSGFLVRTVTPQIGFTSAAGAWDVQLEAARRYEFYTRDGSNPGHRAVDHAGLHVGREWSETGRIALDGRYDRTPELLDAPLRTAYVAGDARYWDGTAFASWGRFEAEGRSRGWAYSDRDADDAASSAWSARFLPVLLPEGAWFLGWHDVRLDLGPRSMAHSRAATVGVRRRITPLLTGELEAGGAETVFADGARRQGPTLIFGLRGAAGDQDIATSVSLQRDLATAVSAEIGRDLGDGRAWARGESLVDIEGGIYRYPTVTRRLTVGAQDTLARSMVLGCQAICTRAAPLHFAGVRTQAVRASAWLTRRLRPWLEGRGEWSYLQLAGRTGPGVTPRRVARLDLSVTATWD